MLRTGRRILLGSPKPQNGRPSIGGRGRTTILTAKTWSGDRVSIGARKFHFVGGAKGKKSAQHADHDAGIPGPAGHQQSGLSTPQPSTALEPLEAKTGGQNLDLLTRIERLLSASLRLIDLRWNISHVTVKLPPPAEAEKSVVPVSLLRSSLKLSAAESPITVPSNLGFIAQARPSPAPAVQEQLHCTQKLPSQHIDTVASATANLAEPLPTGFVGPPLDPLLPRDALGPTRSEYVATHAAAEEVLRRGENQHTETIASATAKLAEQTPVPPADKLAEGYVPVEPVFEDDRPCLALREKISEVNASPPERSTAESDGEGFVRATTLGVQEMDDTVASEILDHAHLAHSGPVMHDTLPGEHSMPVESLGQPARAKPAAAPGSAQVPVAADEATPFESDRAVVRPSFYLTDQSVVAESVEVSVVADEAATPSEGERPVRPPSHLTDPSPGGRPRKQRRPRKKKAVSAQEAVDSPGWVCAAPLAGRPYLIDRLVMDFLPLPRGFSSDAPSPTLPNRVWPPLDEHAEMRGRFALRHPAIPAPQLSGIGTVADLRRDAAEREDRLIARFPPTPYSRARHSLSGTPDRRLQAALCALRGLVELDALSMIDREEKKSLQNDPQLLRLFGTAQARAGELYAAEIVLVLDALRAADLIDKLPLTDVLVEV